MDEKQPHTDRGGNQDTPSDQKPIEHDRERELNKFGFFFFFIPGVLLVISALPFFNYLGWYNITIWVGSILFIIYGLNCLVQDTERAVTTLPRRDDQRTAAWLFASCAIEFIGIFPSFCCACWHLYGASAFTTTGAEIHWLDWMSYTVDNLCSVLLLDTCDIYGIEISNIKHTKTFWPSTIVWVFRVSMVFGLVRLIMLTIKYPKSQPTETKLITPAV
jgi:hypothetical protein